MVDRLTALDASFLYLEESGTPMHVGGVLVLEAPPGGLSALAALVPARLPLVPRYRQRVREVPGHLANPVWRGWATRCAKWCNRVRRSVRTASSR